MPPITEDQLLDKHGRPLRGAVRASRIAAIQRRQARVSAAPLTPPPAVAPEAAAVERPRTRPAPSRLRSLWRLRAPTLSARGLRVAAMAITMTFVLATVIGTTGLVSWRGTVAFGASTTLTIISGEVSVRTSDTDDFRPVTDGTPLRAGMTVRTGPGSYAVLTYFEGSTVSLDPATTLLIRALGADPDGSTLISMEQDAGRTWHSVTKLLRPTSKYEVRTPTATATVRGTAFAVRIGADEQGELTSTVETTEGAVATAKLPTPAEPQPEAVLVQPGFQVTVKGAAPLEQPRPAPEPERKVTVTLGASAGLVLDPVGRANGVKNGKVIVQTPGAAVRIEDGKLVVSLPDIPDGRVATVVDPSVVARAAVDVVTTVSERGGAERKTEAKAEATTSAAPPVIAVEVKKGGDARVATTTEDERKGIASSVKVADPPTAARAAGTSGDDSRNTDTDRKDADKEKDAKRDGSGPGAPGGRRSGLVPAVGNLQLPTQPRDQGRGSTGPAAGSGAAPAKAEAPQGDGAPRPEPPKVEPPKVDATRNEAPTVEAPKAEAPKPEAQRPESQRPVVAPPPPEVAKRDAPKETEKPSTNEKRGAFVPQVELPSLPFGGGDAGGGRGSSGRGSGGRGPRGETPAGGGRGGP